MTKNAKIIYTQTDEAPGLATFSLLPIIQAFASPASVELQTRDISLSGRILAAFSDRLPPEQRVADDLAELGQLAKTPEANIIKLPNISASIPQMKAAIAELKEKGYALPDYPDEPTTDDERDAKARYDKVKGSAVNPVLREGNSDRRAPKPVKEYARQNPHSMGEWSADSKSHVASMSGDDFRSNERSRTIGEATEARIEHVGAGGDVTVLKDKLALEPGEVIDGTVMRKRALVAFLEEQVEDAKKQGVLFSLHMKATMMKVSDPIIFGHAVRAYFKDVFEKHGATLDEVGADVRSGFGDVQARLAQLPADTRAAIEADIGAVYQRGPKLAMVDSDRGITNLHVPSDVIIDASMPAMIRSSGKMWNADNQLQDAKAVIPDSSYAAVYQEVIEFCKKNGALDPKTMGSVPNVGLMAQKAEEYGSHDKTFEMQKPGTVRVVTADGDVLFEHEVEEGDIWRACQTKDAAIRDWVQLAVRRSRESKTPAVFWLDESRAHDAELIAKVKRYLADEDTSGLDIQILAPAAATRHALERIAAGKDTISVTGNVLRDYLTDLFPILEVGTSAKMLSIVPLMNGGGLFETGAGGSAPKHVQQLLAEGHLRWDSLGEFMALAASLEHLASRVDGAGAKVLADTLDDATAQVLLNRKSPSRKAGELDNRGSHFYLALYWAKALAAQREHAALAERFANVARELSENEETILAELSAGAGKPVDVGGYYMPDPARAEAAMRPSKTLNRIIGGV